MRPEGSDRVYSRVSQEDLKTIASSLLETYGDEKVWLFFGEIGAGKTTLIKALAESLGVAGGMSSPTFSIINEYETENGAKIFHFDFYRIREEAEALDIGVEEYFYSGSYCFIEWPEKIPSLIPDNHVAVRITGEDAEHRTIVISIHDRKEENWI